MQHGRFIRFATVAMPG